MTNKQLQKKQDELDKETGVCRKCGKEERWGFLREWGDCDKCVAKYYQEAEDTANENKVNDYLYDKRTKR